MARAAALLVQAPLLSYTVAVAWAAASGRRSSGLPSDWWTVNRRFPSVWFGANSTGPDAEHLSQDSITKYSAVYFG